MLISKGMYVLTVDGRIHQIHEVKTEGLKLWLHLTDGIMCRYKWNSRSKIYQVLDDHTGQVVRSKLDWRYQRYSIKGVFKDLQLAKVARLKLEYGDLDESK